MALWQFSNKNKYGNWRSRIVYLEGALSHPGGAFGKAVSARRFKYEYNHPVMPPTIFKHNGKTYLMPLWKEVVDGTTINDIEWVKPKPKVKKEPIVKTFTSGSSDNVYETKYYPESGKYYCSCPGAWRSFGNCKHIKQMRKENE